MEKKYTGKSLVFGDLLELRNIQVQGTPDEVAQLYKEITELEKRLFTAFISFILSRAGYYNDTILDLYPWDIKDEIVYTTQFRNEDWVRLIDAFSCWEEFRRDLTDAEYEMMKNTQEWTVRYANERGEILNIKFLSGFAFWYFTEIPIDEGNETKRIKWVDRYLLTIDKTIKNYIVVHPVTYDENKLGFKELNSYLTDKLGEPVLFSVDGFLHKFFPEKTKKFVIIDAWLSIREEILKEIRQKWPIIVFATHSKQLSKINERLSSAELKYKQGKKYFEDAIKDAALACEELLQVIYEMNMPKQIEKSMHFYDFLCKLKEVIIDEFGENTYNDLDFIRIWRNKVLHPHPEEPDEMTTFQIIRRAEMFYKTFLKWSKKRRSKLRRIFDEIEE